MWRDTDARIGDALSPRRVALGRRSQLITSSVNFAALLSRFISACEVGRDRVQPIVVSGRFTTPLPASPISVSDGDRISHHRTEVDARRPQRVLYASPHQIVGRARHLQELTFNEGLAVAMGSPTRLQRVGRAGAPKNSRSCETMPKLFAVCRSAATWLSPLIAQQTPRRQVVLRTARAGWYSPRLTPVVNPRGIDP
jgi:hypothetical protein